MVFNCVSLMPDPRGLCTCTLKVCIVLLLRSTIPVVCQCSGNSLTVTGTNDFQYLATPGYNDGAGTYSSDLSCSWVLDGGSSSWKIFLYVENYDVTCPGDFIDIYDGNQTTSTALVTALCGTSQSGVYTSSQRYVRVDFTSDSSNQGSGFKLAFMIADDLSGSGCSSEQALTATSTPQYLTSPNFPGLYTVNSNCRWVITAPEGTVSLEIIFSDVETSTNCAFDSLEIYSGTYVCDRTKIISACTPHPNGVTASLISNGTSFLVKFAADASLSFHGFVIKFSQIAAVADTTSASAVVSSVSSEGDFYLGLYIGLGSGAGGAFLFVGVVTLIRHFCTSSKVVSPNVKHVEPLSIRSTPSRNNSICGSSSSSGDSTSRQKSFLCSTPVSPGSAALMLDIQRRKSSHYNGFMHQ
ncbi:procollagen C-endopeptidase enhancer 2-like isoform X2 [Argopecten irradians]|uniref:procollagen C-endopeptidase enhancer 2-like isoform X2 n=1 Tax=Argopecten irradians TaxID=31199 RepID=UPI00371CBBBB